MSNKVKKEKNIIEKGKLEKLVSSYSASDVVSQIESAIATSQVNKIPIKDLELLPLFSKKNYDMESINIIERSIKKQGLIVPIFVYKYDGKTYVVNGVKRFLALQHLKQEYVSAVYLECSIEEVFFYVLNNMMSNKDNSLVQAYAYDVLIGKYGYTERDIRKITHLSHGQINNTLRLLKLCPSVTKLVVESKLSHGKARLLVTFDEMEQIELAQLFMSNSVRECEQIARNYREGNASIKYNFNYNVDGKRVTIDVRDDKTLDEIIDFLKEKRKNVD
ncbi:MAG: ParB/RepB/Spo0J family partition protein [Bacilli bacterium]